MSGYDPYEDRLRRVLLAEADTVLPAGDGLTQIRAKVERRRNRLRWLRPTLAVGTAAALGGAGVFAFTLGEPASHTLKDDRPFATSSPTPPPSTSLVAPPPVTGKVYPIWPFTSRAEVEGWQRSGADSATWHLDAAQTALRFMGYLQAPEVDTVMTTEPETTSVGAGTKVTLGRKMADGKLRAVTVVHLVRLGAGDTAPYVVTRAAGAYTLKITSPGIAAPVRSPLLVRGTMNAVGIAVRVELRTPARPTPISAPAETGANIAWSDTLRFAGGGNGIATLVARAEEGDGALEIFASPVLLAGGAPAGAAYPSTFVAAASGRIAVFDSTTGKLVRYLTTRQPGGGDSEPTVTADRKAVYFLRGAGTCASGIWRVPYAGGAEMPLVTVTGSVVRITDADNGPLLAYSDAGCTLAHPAVLIKFVASGRTNGIGVPIGVSVGDLALSSSYGLAFTSRNGASSELRVLDPGVAKTTAASRVVPAPDPECPLATPAWTPTALVAVELCSSANGGSRLLTFDPHSLQLVRRGPGLSQDLGIGTLSSDQSGNLVGQLEGGDTIGAIIVVSDGKVRTLANGHCTSVDPTPYPCATGPDW